MNQQPPEKRSMNENGSLQVHSIFKTIQGEGPFTGYRAVFIRLAGCNLQCPLCDTNYTDPRTEMTPDEIVEAVKEHSTEIAELLVVITGGEPFRQNLGPLIEKLVDLGCSVQLETNGTLYQELPFHSIDIVCSPKTGSINEDLAPFICALKYVICADDVSTVDGLPKSALKHPVGGQLARPPEGFYGIIYVQPADEGDELKNQLNLQTAMRSVMDFGYTLQLQIHKLIGAQ